MKNYFMAGLLGTTLLTAGCSKEFTEKATTDNAVLRVTMQGENPTTKAIAANALANDKSIKNYTVLVYDYDSGLLEKVKVVSDNSSSTTLTDLSSAGAKRVVVVANVNGMTGLPAFTERSSNYSDLANTANTFTLENQRTDKTFLDANGLVMTGEAASAVVLSPTGTNNVTVTVRRIVAKIVLGEIKISPTVGALANFTLNSVSIQQANSTSTFATGIPITGGEQWGGIIGTTSTVAKSYLIDNTLAIPNGYTPNTAITCGNFFYVFPNGSINPVMMTIGGTYNYSDGQGPKTVYFPVKINYQSGSENTDGTYVLRNKIYTLNITLQKLSQGSNNPDILPVNVPLTVTIEIADWEDSITQNESW